LRWQCIIKHFAQRVFKVAAAAVSVAGHKTEALGGERQGACNVLFGLQIKQFSPVDHF
jgi:hypothetical protein